MGAVESRVDVATIRKEVDSSPVVLYTKTQCSFCGKAKSLLADEKIDYKENNLDDMKERHPKEFSALVNGLVYHTRVTSVPQIFICGKYVGGYTELCSLQESKQLLDAVAACAKEAD